MSEVVVEVREPTPAELDPSRFRQRRRVIEGALATGVPVALLVLWQVASSTGMIDQRLYPSPWDIILSTRELVAERDLLWHLGISIRRILLGYLLGVGVGVGAGLAMGVSRTLRAALEPLLSALYTVPKLALLPVFLTVLGFGEPPIVALIGVTVFFFVWISTLAAVLAVPDGYIEAARSLGVRGRTMFRHVILPASLPQIFVGLRIAAGVSVLMLIGVEFVIGGEGLGFLIEQGRTLLLLEQTYVGIVLSALLGLGFSALVRAIGRRLTPWAREIEAVPLA